MKELDREIQKTSDAFLHCRKALIALGDENRQHLILEMMKMGSCTGVRVGDITRQTHLSRPAVSHHLQILKDAGIIQMRKEGTMHYYYFDADPKAMNQLLDLVLQTKKIMGMLPKREANAD